MINMNKVTKALEYLSTNHYAEWCNEYGEPGYTNPEKGIILCNWNDVPKGLADWLKKCGYSLEWSDEWTIDYAYSKAYRTSPDSYHWEASVMLSNDGEWITPDDGASAWIDECEVNSNGQPIKCLPSWINADEILNSGFELMEGDFENGHFPGQNDEPSKIVKKYFEDGAYSVLFQKSENSQFYIRFRVWVKWENE